MRRAGFGARVHDGRLVKPLGFFFFIVRVRRAEHFIERRSRRVQLQAVAEYIVKTPALFILLSITFQFLLLLLLLLLWLVPLHLYLNSCLNPNLTTSTRLPPPPPALILYVLLLTALTMRLRGDMICKPAKYPAASALCNPNYPDPAQSYPIWTPQLYFLFWIRPLLVRFSVQASIPGTVLRSRNL